MSSSRGAEDARSDPSARGGLREGDGDDLMFCPQGERKRRRAGCRYFFCHVSFSVIWRFVSRSPPTLSPRAHARTPRHLHGVLFPKQSRGPLPLPNLRHAKRGRGRRVREKLRAAVVRVPDVANRMLRQRSISLRRGRRLRRRRREANARAVCSVHGVLLSAVRVHGRHLHAVRVRASEVVEEE